MKSIILNIKSFTDGVSKNNISAHAAASAFYMFLSLVPFVALITTILPLTGLQQDKLFGIISRYIPSAMQALINSTLTDIYSASDAVLPISVITTIWLSSRAFSSLIRGVEDIAESPRYSSYLKRSLLACLYTIGLISVMVILLFLLVFGHRLSTLPLLSPFVRLIIELRFLVAAIILSLVFIAVYYWVPGMRLKITELLPGAGYCIRCVAIIHMDVFAVYRLQRRLLHLWQPCRYHNNAAVDVLVYVYYSPRFVFKYVYIPKKA